MKKSVFRFKRTTELQHNMWRKFWKLPGERKSHAKYLE